MMAIIDITQEQLMKTLPSGEVQNKFGSIANLVKSGETVTVTQYGTPTMMILPYILAAEALKEYNARRLIGFMDAMPPAHPDAPELTLEEINDLVHELRP
jgi:antitoxin (DNA-binding transcriptional repressor) of toxin-antitoxin stability system